jgi:hypothetical protein
MANGRPSDPTSKYVEAHLESEQGLGQRAAGGWARLRSKDSRPFDAGEHRPDGIVASVLELGALKALPERDRITPCRLNLREPFEDLSIPEQDVGRSRARADDGLRDRCRPSEVEDRAKEAEDVAWASRLPV